MNSTEAAVAILTTIDASTLAASWGMTDSADVVAHAASLVEAFGPVEARDVIECDVRDFLSGLIR